MLKGISVTISTILNFLFVLWYTGSWHQTWIIELGCFAISIVTVIIVMIIGYAGSQERW